MIFDNTRARQIDAIFFEDLPASTGDVLGARGEEAFVRNPVPSMFRQAELTDAEKGYTGLGFEFGDEDFQQAPTGPMLTPEAAQAKFGHLGLTFKKPITEEAAEIEADRKRAEIARQKVLERAQGGFLEFSAGLATELAVTALDPINVASAFVPAVGPARFALMSQRFGKTGARAATGVAEGALGAALVEPIILTAAVNEQADYDHLDSFLNIVFGGALGGGLHVGAGALGDALTRAARRAEGAPPGNIGDALDRLPIETKEAALRTSVARMAEGKPVRADLVLMADDDFIRAMAPAASRGKPLAQSPASDWTLGRLTGEGQAARYETYQPLKPEDLRQIEGLVEEVALAPRGHLTFVDNPHGPGQEVIGVKSMTPHWFQRANQHAKELNDFRAQQKQRGTPDDKLVQGAPILTVESISRVAEKLRNYDPLGRAEADIASELVGEARARRARNAQDFLTDRRQRGEEFRAEIEAFAERELDEGDPLGDLRQTEPVPERARETGPEAAEVADTEAGERLQELLDALGLKREDVPELKEADVLLEDAKAWERAIRAAAVCDLRA